LRRRTGFAVGHPRSLRNPVSGFRYQKLRGKFTAEESRWRYSWRGISMAPNFSRCGVSHWVSSRVKRRSRNCSTSARSAILDASRTW